MKTKSEAKQYRFKVSIYPEFSAWQTFDLKKFKDDCATYASIGIDFLAEFRNMDAILEMGS